MEENNKIAVSVCISIYNGEKLMQRCLDSVIKQTLKSMEIVIVNDGSTDNSVELLNKYKEEHPERSILIISQQNKGLAQGRNTGVKYAHGEYIAFLDQDDYFHPTACEKMYNAAVVNNADIVEVETKHGDVTYRTPYNGIKDSHEVLRHYFLGDKKVQSMLWMRLYKRQLFNKPVFPEFRVNNEDVFAWPCLLYASRNIYFLPEQLHVYSEDNTDSVMNRLRKDPAFATRYYEARKIALRCFDHIQNYIGSKVLESDYNPSYQTHIARSVFFFFATHFPGVDYSKKKKDVCNIISRLSSNNLESFVRHYFFAESILEKLVKLLGLRMSLYIVRLFHR